MKLLILCTTVFFVSCLQAQPVLKLWYRQPAQKWTDALPIGNGSLGAMIYAGIEQDQLQFNESTLWTGSPRDYQHPGASKHLGAIRQLLFDGKQQEAESLAEKTFMGLKDVEDSTYASQKKEWLRKQRSDTSYAGPGIDDSKWPQMPLLVPNGWEAAGLEGLDGAVWFRASFNLPAEWVGKDMKVDLGRIRDADFTYINGRLVGSAEGISTKRSYVIPAAYLKAGKNTIAVQVINFFDKGGFTGIKEDRKILLVYPAGKTTDAGIALPGKWKYHIQNDDPPVYPQYEASYQPFGDLFFDFPQHKTVTGYQRSLDLTNAMATTIYQAGGVAFKRTYFASAPQKAVVVRFTADKAGMISLNAHFSSPHLHYRLKKIDDQTIGLYVQVRHGALQGVSYLHVVTNSGKLTVSDTSIRLQQVNEAVFYLVAATNYVNYKDVSASASGRCNSVLQAIKATNFQQVLSSHTRDYQRQFNRFAVSFGNSSDTLPTDERIKRFSAVNDPSFLALYMQYARYLMIASSNAHASQPANLQGIWNNLLTPPWGSKYTTNINLEMNYWPAEPLNLSDCTVPLFRAIDEMSVTGALTARAHYGSRGWVLHHNTDLWRGTAPINASNHGIWVSGSAWLCQHIWEHYLFTQDRSFLEKQYPVMKAAAEFYVDFLVKDPRTGWLISTPSNSPEQGGLVAGPTMDHQIIRELFRYTISAAKTLHTDEALQKRLQEKYAAIAPNQIGKHGQLQEWLQDVDDTTNKHRHVSHLWGVFPGTDITWKDSAVMKAARQSLLYRGDDGTGWSLAWKTNLWARFKDGEHALKMAAKLLSDADEGGPAGERGGVYKNLFDAHPPFQIDGNFGGAAGIAEMLVQSQGEKIDILPALPAALRNGYVKGLCARSGFELDMEWHEGQLKKITVTSKAGNTCNLQYGSKKITFATASNKRYTFNRDLQQVL